ncbi:MAG: hypothetical protein ACKPKO_26505, partial [Candidatus Fonsibacter sp.]
DCLVGGSAWAWFEVELLSGPGAGNCSVGCQLSWSGVKLAAILDLTSLKQADQLSGFVSPRGGGFV